jgi:hypothetical protein
LAARTTAEVRSRIPKPALTKPKYQRFGTVEVFIVGIILEVFIGGIIAKLLGPWNPTTL